MTSKWLKLTQDLSEEKTGAWRKFKTAIPKIPKELAPEEHQALVDAMVSHLFYQQNPLHRRTAGIWPHLAKIPKHLYPMFQTAVLDAFGEEAMAVSVVPQLNWAFLVNGVEWLEGFPKLADFRRRCDLMGRFYKFPRKPTADTLVAYGTLLKDGRLGRVLRAVVDCSLDDIGHAESNDLIDHALAFSLVAEGSTASANTLEQLYNAVKKNGHTRLSVADLETYSRLGTSQAIKRLAKKLSQRETKRAKRSGIADVLADLNGKPLSASACKKGRLELSLRSKAKGYNVSLLLRPGAAKDAACVTLYHERSGKRADYGRTGYLGRWEDPFGLNLEIDGARFPQLLSKLADTFGVKWVTTEQAIAAKLRQGGGLRLGAAQLSRWLG